MHGLIILVGVCNMTFLNEQKKEATERKPAKPVKIKQPFTEQVSKVSTNPPAVEEMVSDNPPAITVADNGQETPAVNLPPSAVGDIDLTAATRTGVGYIPELQDVPDAPRLWEPNDDERLDQNPFRGSIIETSFPKVYAPSLDGNVSTQRSFELIGVAAAYQERQAERQAQAARDRVRQLTTSRGTLPNTPDATGNWIENSALWASTGVNRWLFGTEEQQRRAASGEFNIREGLWGRRGAGLGGQIMYLLNLPPAVIAGASAEANKLFSGTLQRFGINKDRADDIARNGFASLLPKNSPLRPSNILGFDWQRARSQNNLSALFRGENIEDLGEARGSDKGNVFYSPRRQPNSPWYTDIPGQALNLAFQVFNPADRGIDNLAEAFLRGRKPPITVTPRKASETAAELLPPNRANLVTSGKPLPPKKFIENFSYGSRELPTRPLYETGQDGVFKAPPYSVNRTSTETAIGSAQELTAKPGAVFDFKSPELTSVESALRQVDNITETSTEAALRQADSIKPKTTITPEVNVRVTPQRARDIYDFSPPRAVIKAADEVFEDIGKLDVPISEDSIKVLDDIKPDNLKLDEMTKDELLDLYKQTGETKVKLDTQLSEYDSRIFDDTPDIGRQALPDVNEVPEGFVRTNKKPLRQRTPPKLLKSYQSLVTTIESSRFYHGTALDIAAKLPDNIASLRGDLGQGFYLTNNADVAQMYAKARLGDNADSLTTGIQLKPQVLNFSGGEIPNMLLADKVLPKSLINKLAPDLIVNWSKLVGTDINYKQFLQIIEDDVSETVGKFKLNPETVFAKVFDELGSRLRKAGFNGVFDEQSGFASIFDSSNLKFKDSTLVPQPSVLEAAKARLDADNLSSLMFPKSPAATANLVDSQYRLIEQVKDKVDELQEQIITNVVKRDANDLPDLPQRQQVFPNPPNKLRDSELMVYDQAVGYMVYKKPSIKSSANYDIVFINPQKLNDYAPNLNNVRGTAVSPPKYLTKAIDNVTNPSRRYPLSIAKAEFDETGKLAITEKLYEVAAARELGMTEMPLMVKKSAGNRVPDSLLSDYKPLNKLGDDIEPRSINPCEI